jgi:hypothetical protein
MTEVPKMGQGTQLFQIPVTGYINNTKAAPGPAQFVYRPRPRNLVATIIRFDLWGFRLLAEEIRVGLLSWPQKPTRDSVRPYIFSSHHIDSSL